MNRRTILITGAEGQLGQLLQRYFTTTNHDVIAPSEATLLVTNADAVHAAIDSVQPDIVIHAAAVTAVDWCESHPDEAAAVNVTGTHNVVTAARNVGARVIYLSTDYVFDGTKRGPYVETDVPNPMSVYGKTKLAGEQQVHPSDLIVRTSWLYSAVGNNIFVTLAKLAQGSDTLHFVTDQVGHPTSAVDLANRIGWMIDHDVTGIVHATNQGVVSWFEFAQAVFVAFGKPESRIVPVLTHELVPPRPAPRPKNSVLENAALTAVGAPPARDFRDTLPELVREFHSRR